LVAAWEKFLFGKGKCRWLLKRCEEKVRLGGRKGVEEKWELGLK